MDKTCYHDLDSFYELVQFVYNSLIIRPVLLRLLDYYIYIYVL
jgi:hypothetical protein